MFRRLWLACRFDYLRTDFIGTTCWILTNHATWRQCEKGHKKLFSEADYSRRCLCGIFYRDYQNKRVVN